MGYAYVTKIIRQIGILPPPFQAPDTTPNCCGRAFGFGYVRHGTRFQQIIPDSAKMIVQVRRRHIDHHQSISVVSYRAVLGEFDLTENDDRSYDQHDGNGEL